LEIYTVIAPPLSRKKARVTGQAHLKIAKLFHDNGQIIDHAKRGLRSGGCFMGMRLPSSFQDHCVTLTDPRCPYAPHSHHLLMDMLVMAVCAVISGAEGWEDIEE